MSDKELTAISIDIYRDLQRIKKLSGDEREKEIDAQIKIIRAKLEALGIVTDDLNII